MSTNNVTNRDEQLVLIQKELKEVMAREIKVMRELLGNLQEEQQVILTNATEALKAVMKDREPLLDVLLACRKQRIEVMRRLSKLTLIDTRFDGELTVETLTPLLEIGDSDSCEVLSMKDQMLALLDNMNRQTERNNYLIQNRVALTKEMIRRLHPGDTNPTYTNTGTVGAKNRTTVMIINREV